MTMISLKSHLKPRLLCLLRWSLKVRSTSGFTLLELLVALAIGSLIVTGLLYGVVELMQTNQRDASRSDTQREVQSALDYMARDLKEAVYVYDGRCLQGDGANPFNKTAGQKRCPGVLNYVPAALNDATSLPVLAFWRVDPLPQNLIDRCRTSAGTANAATSLQGVPCISQRMYTLVVYALNTDNSNRLWRGRGRITRYELPQFTTASITGAGAPTATPGWVNPLQGQTNFETWPWGADTAGAATQNLQAKNGGRPTSMANNLVLIDFVDNREDKSTPPRGIQSIAANANSGVPGDLSNGWSNLCPTPAYDSANPTLGGFIMSPGNDLATGAKSTLGFYTCVRGADANNLNQEVAIYIRGNAAGRPGIPVGTGNLPFLMETRVLTRGAIGKVNQ
ncbi:PulJ/GspJ family protein [Alkalinema pantanalense CENA528]